MPGPARNIPIREMIIPVFPAAGKAGFYNLPGQTKNRVL
jgi:hypothetical protein